MKRLLYFLHRSAVLLKPLRIPLMAFTFCALLLTAYSLLASSSFAVDYLESAIVASLWGMLILAAIELFKNLPDPVLPHDSFWQRLMSRGRIVLFYLLALLVTLVSAMLFWLSMRLFLI